MRVTDLWVFPVKSLAGYRTARATVEPWGLVGDRRWGLVDGAGTPVTAREVHALLGVTAESVDEKTLRLTGQGGDDILVEAPVGVPAVPVGFSRQGYAVPADEDVNRWLSREVGAPVRLVWQEDPTTRTISPVHGGRPGDHVSLADTSPLLLTSRASMDQLNAWLAAADPPVAPLDIRRFRGNVVVDGDEAFAEDTWAEVRIGDVVFRRTELCDRCVMTTLDPDTLEGGKEPIRTLARYRRWDGATWFGLRLVRTGGGTEIAVGDLVDPVRHTGPTHSACRADTPNVTKPSGN